MTAQETYYTFTLLFNKSSEQSNIYLEKEDFVILYNREAERFISDYLERNNVSDNIFNISDLLVKDKKLASVSSTGTEEIYKKPEDFFSLVHGDFRSYSSSASCNNVIYNNVFKPEHINAVLSDKFTRPSLSWERGVAKITKDQIVVYKDNFNITYSTISYYKQPTKIDLEGYTKMDGSPSRDINPDISDYLVNQILDRVVLEAHREQENSGGFNLSQTRERGY